MNLKSDLVFQHHLVVVSAVGKPEIALSAWNTLIQLWDVEELDSISLRFLPAVYVNIGHLNKDLSPKLQGKYRYNSVRNIQRLRSLKPIIKIFDELSIDYRLVKGFAISLRMQTLGYRIMGDIDIVIRHRDLQNVLRIFSDFGFADKFQIRCKNYSFSSKQEKYTLVDDNGTEIDLHVAENAFPSKAFKKMFQGQTSGIHWEGCFIKIPSDQLLISHSLLHGLQSTSVTDRWQTLVDVNVIERVSALNKLGRFSSLSKRIAKTFDDQSKIFDVKNIDQFEFAFKSLSLTFYYWINKLRSHNVTVNSSLSRGLSHSLSVNHNPIMRLAYSIWYFLGARAFFESIMCNLLGGFLGRPKNTIKSGQIYLPIQQIDTFSTIQNVFDYRLRFQVYPKISKIDFHFDSEIFKQRRYEIFCNGKLIGVSSNSGVFGVSYFGKASNLEISIRNPSHACHVCFESFAKLKVRFEYEDLI